MAENDIKLCAYPVWIIIFTGYQQKLFMVVLVLAVHDNDSATCYCKPLLFFLFLIQKTSHIYDYIIVVDYSVQRDCLMASCSINAIFQSSSEILPDIGENPNQPIKYNFPKQALCAKEVTNRSFHPQWFQKWSWIHYDEACDIVFCSICEKAARSK